MTRTFATPFVVSGRRLSGLLLAGVLTLFSGATLAKPNSTASFDGTWSGTGIIDLAGRPEPIACQVKNTNKSGNEYFSNFTCALESFGSGSLTMTVERTGSNRFAGRFYDSINQVNVQVSVLQEGRNQKVHLKSRKWQGVLYLQK